MKWSTILILLFTMIIVIPVVAQENEQGESMSNQNPFYMEYDTPFGVPPFDKIHEDHYLPAFIDGFAQESKEIEAIANNPESPTFENTIEAMEKTGELLTKVGNVFYNLNSSMTNEKMQAIAKEISPMSSKHSDDIRLNFKLFSRIKYLYERKDELNLTREQEVLLKKRYDEFVRGGAELNKEDKAKLRKFNEQISLLTLKFGENVLKENNKFELVIEDKNDLAGLTPASISAAAEAAKERGYDGKWVFTLHKPSLIPFLQFSEKRNLREIMYKGYINRGDNGGDLDNNKILARIAALRVSRANLLGYKTHADYVLEQNMAKTPEAVYNLLNKLWKPALAVAKKEAVAMQEMIEAEGNDFKLEGWDWWYYAEKIKKAEYDLDESMLRPYFKLENVIDGVLMAANKLWGIQIVELKDMPKYHPDVKVFEVKEADGSHIAILYTDYFPRASKRGGAWMNEFREYSNMDGKVQTPVVVNVGNFSKPTGDTPALISLDEVHTLFHEFGHALHGMLTKAHYPSLSGTNVPRDFVELCSQIMENWATHPEVLKMYAKHYKTGEPIPDELIAKIEKSGKFNQGFVTVEYLAASFLDMDWHTITETEELDPHEFETESMDKIGLIPEIVSRYRSQYFSHIFAGGYSSGYYSYIWAEVLDADAFEAFKETDVFDQKTAKAFRDNILATGGSEDPMVLYIKFRGAEPKIEPILERRGLN
jgi:peptidyl-dipeptidase Dcp